MLYFSVLFSWFYIICADLHCTDLLFLRILTQEECIPVGCVPPAAVAVSVGVFPGGMGGCMPGGGSAQWGCLPRGGWLPRGVSAQLGCTPPPSPVNRMTEV